MGSVPPIESCDFTDKIRLGCESPSQKMAMGKGLTDYPLFKADFEGEEIFVYRHPYFFILDSVWEWWNEYSYYKRVQDNTPYYSRDPRYMDAVRIYENELNIRSAKK